MKKIEISFFGVFKSFGLDSMVVEVPEDYKVGDLRQYLKEKHFHGGPLDMASLLESSVFASEIEILQEDEPIKIDRLSLLPPVCGG